MPGIDSCGRCGTVLNLGAVVIDVNPPRASRAAKRLRKVVPRRAIYAARDTAAEAASILRGRVIDEARVPLPEPAILARLGVPGWAHIHAGLILRGRAFLGAYLAFLWLGLFRWGSDLGPIFLGLAFSVHASSILDILVRQGTVRFPRMMLTAAVVFLTLGGLVYYPAGLVLSQVASPIGFLEEALPFARYDTVLVNRWAFALREPRPGDVVLFRPISDGRSRADNGVPGTRIVIEETVLIDRVLGGPGDRVVWEKGRLSVNGAPVPWTPLVPRVLPEKLEVTVPAGVYLVLPTASRATQTAGLGDWKTVGLITRDAIEGGAFLRPSPLSRWWFIR